MKTILTITLLTLGLGTISAQKIKEAQVPDSVKAAFSKQYPGIKGAKWEKDGVNFEAEFDLNKIETSVLISPNGIVLSTEMEINISELPKEAINYIAKNLVGKKIKDASKIIDNKGEVTFEAEIEKVDYVFNEKGLFIKKNP